MAGLPPCMNHPETPAVSIVTMLESGDVITVCGECLTGFCEAMLEAATGLPVGEILHSIINDGPITEPAEDAPDPTLGDSASPGSLDDATAPDPRGQRDEETDDEYYGRMADLDAHDESPATTQS